MKFSPCALLSEVVVIEPQPFQDERGFLARTFCEREFSAAGIERRWVQHNHTLTRGAGSVRGLHYQGDSVPEAKVVRCLQGRVFDVAVDVRPDSPGFGTWVSCELSSENKKALFIPEGFAHGFQCLSETCELLYLMSEYYVPELARGLDCEDDEVGIQWPLPVVGLSERDQRLPSLAEIREGEKG